MLQKHLLLAGSRNAIVVFQNVAFSIENTYYFDFKKSCSKSITDPSESGTEIRQFAISALQKHLHLPGARTAITQLGNIE